VTLPEIAIRRPITTLMLLISVIVLGAVALTRLPLAFLPDVERPMLFVRVPYSNATPEQVERMVVRPLEEALGSVKGVRNMESSCDRDGGRVRLEFDWGHPLDLARVEIREKLDRVRRELPDDVGDVTIGGHWGSRDTDDPILEGRLSSNRDLSESYDLLERKIIRPLERIPGVAQVRLDGVNPREVRINLRVADLEAHGIDVREVTRILRENNFDQTLGTIVEADVRYTARTVAVGIRAASRREVRRGRDGDEGSRRQCGHDL